MRGVPGLAARHQGPIELLPDKLMCEWIVAQDRWSGDTIDDLADHIFFGNTRKSVADQPGVSFDFNIAGRERRLAVHTHELDVKGNVKRRRRDADNFHRGTIRCRASVPHLSQRRLWRPRLRASAGVAYGGRAPHSGCLQLAANLFYLRTERRESPSDRDAACYSRIT